MKELTISLHKEAMRRGRHQPQHRYDHRIHLEAHGQLCSAGLLGNLCQQLYNTVDSVIVGKFVGKQALAAVASSGNLIFMMTGFFMGLFIGAGIVIAQYFGAKNYEKVRAAVHTDFAFALCCGVLLTLLGVFFTPTILTWMRTPADVLDTSILYFRLYFLGSLATILYNAGMGILQAVGDSRSPLYYLVISSAVNVALDLLFVGAMDMGVAGAAVATVISQVVSAVLCIIKLTRSDGPYRLEIKRIGFDLPLLKKITSQGIPSGVQNSIIAIANVVVQSNINTFGSDAMAGCGSYSKVEGFVFLPITAFAMALTTFIGQNLGAGQFDRAKQGARIGILCSMAMAELIGVALFSWPPMPCGCSTTTRPWWPSVCVSPTSRHCSSASWPLPTVCPPCCGARAGPRCLCTPCWAAGASCGSAISPWP